MRVLVLGCPTEGVSFLSGLRFARELRPLQLLFWDADRAKAVRLLEAVGAGVCLEAVKPAMLRLVDMAIVLDERFAAMAPGIVAVVVRVPPMKGKGYRHRSISRAAMRVMAMAAPPTIDRGSVDSPVM